MKTRLFGLLLFVFILPSCKREPYPQPVVNQPVFGLTGTLNGEPFNLQAGNNNLYLTSSLVQNEFGVYQFTSAFNSTTCSGCEPVFSVTINDLESLDPDVSSSAEILNPAILSFAFSNSNSDFLTLNFDTPNIQNGNFNWNFGDGSTSQQNEPQHTYTNPGIYTVTLNVQSGGGQGGCDVTIEQTVLAGSNQHLSMPFNLHDGPGNSIQVSYPNNLPPHLQAQNWTINGNNYQGNNVQFNPPPGNQPIEICLHFYNTQAQEQGEYCLTYDDGPGNNDPCMTQMHYQFEPAQVNLNNVQLTYRNSAGDIFSSISTLNNVSSSKFEILEVSEYQPGVDGNAAKKITAQFHAWLVNIANPSETIYMENMKADFAFRF